MIVHGKIRIRKLEEIDTLLLAKWLSDPELLQYYEGRDRPHDVEMVKEHFYDFYGQNDAETRCIVEYEGEAIGYVQFYLLDRADREQYAYTDFSGVVYGMDQFIGEVAFWNRGIGSLLVRTVVNYITNELGAEKVIMDPQTWNHRAIHCYEKCGFQKMNLLPQHEWHEGEMRDCWLMEYSR